MTGDVMVVTLMRFDPGGSVDARALEPALDVNLDLLERRTALRALFNWQFPRAQGSGIGMSSTSECSGR